MIIFDGKLYDDKYQDRLIKALPSYIMKTTAALDTAIVISACDKLAKRVMAGEFNDTALPFLEKMGYTLDELDKFAGMFTKKALGVKIKTELDSDKKLPGGRIRKRFPLGAILHIAAGNMDVLPVYSVVEGLLAGNINVLKLPSADQGLSVKLLCELIKAEPKLGHYIYVFDVPSSDVESLQKLALACNAVAVWGGDEPVAAVRKLCPPDMKIIEWGHKLSFAYASVDAADDELYRLAEHICRTDQLLCSSAQGIFIDTSSRKEQLAFAERFCDILQSTAAKTHPHDAGLRARYTISAYTADLEGKDIYRGGVAVLTPEDSELELSPMYRNMWVKCLPMDRLYTLKKHKMHLQTASLLMPDESRRKVAAEQLALCGVTRILLPGDMSETVAGEAHDGRYALREYSRIVEFDPSMI